MRVTVITATPPAIPTGSGTFVATEQLTRGLEALGHSVRVVRPAVRPDQWPGFLLRRYAFNRSLDPVTPTKDTDVVVGFDMDGYRLAGRLPVPFVSYLHGVIGDEARFERGLTGWSLRTQARSEATGARAADLVLATSEYSKRTITTLYGVPSSHIRIVPPGIDVDRWLALLGNQTPVPGPPTILCVAHLYPRKNVTALVRAAALVLVAIPDLQVRIVGDGPERMGAERLAGALRIRHAVTFLDHIPLAQLVNEYRACTAFCLPTLQEGFGLVFVEAMVAGKPVVALKAGAVPELVVDGVHGILVPPGDTRALAQALARALTDPALLERAAIESPRRARLFDVRGMARRFVEAVTPVLRAGARVTVPT